MTNLDTMPTVALVKLSIPLLIGGYVVIKTLWWAISLTVIREPFGFKVMQDLLYLQVRSTVICNFILNVKASPSWNYYRVKISKGHSIETASNWSARKTNQQTQKSKETGIFGTKRTNQKNISYKIKYSSNSKGRKCWLVLQIISAVYWCLQFTWKMYQILCKNKAKIITTNPKCQKTPEKYNEKKIDCREI